MPQNFTNFFLIQQNITQLIIFRHIKMENNNFNALIDLIRQNKLFNTILKQREQEYLIKLYKISELNEEMVIELYNTMKKKFYYKRDVSNQEYWYQNQLRIFIYLFFAYLQSFNKNIKSLKQEDWNYFSLIFNYKKPIFFQFQALSIIKTLTKTISWTHQETELLKDIIQQKKMKNRWNSIARELFIRSHKKFFRNPKQCRQRWMNHLDPSKIKTQWSLQQDLALLSCIKKKGKKWSTAVKQLNNTRTEHMVKNRYKSLIYNESKKQPAGKRQFQIQTIIIKRISKGLNKSKKSASLKNQDTQPIKMKQYGVQKTMKNMNNFEQIIEFQEKLKKEVCDDDYIKNEQLWLQNQQLQKIQDCNHQFYKSSPIFIPWRGNMRLNDEQEIDLNYQGKIMIDNQNYQSSENENSNFFKL